MNSARAFLTALAKYRGVRYTWGGKTPADGFDCSGLIHYALGQVGVEFVHGSTAQIDACTPITVDQALATPGALLWFQGHDAISLGNGTTLEAVTSPADGVGSYRHGNRFTRAGLIPGINYNEESEMISPFKGRVTAQWRGYPGHKGMDIAPPLPGQTGMPVYAAFAGRVKALHRTAKHGNRNSTWAPFRTGNGALIENPDGEGNGYNHVMPLASLKVGDWVKAGQLIGYNDSSGNQSGPHLHFEMWGDADNPNSDYDPRDAFSAHKVTPGSAPAKTTGKPSTPASGNTKADNIAIQKALNAMGYKAGEPDGVDGPLMEAAVKEFQEDHGLFPDGDWGSVSQAKYEALGRPKKPIKATASKPVKTYRNLKRGSTGADVLALSRKLRAKGYTQQGDTRTYTAQLEANVKDWQRRSKLRQDGVAGEITQKSLGL